MAKVSTNINLDPELKKAAQELFSDFGLDLTTAVTLFLKQSVREQAIPFAIKRNVPNMETIAAMDEFYEIKEHPEKYKRYSSFKEAMDEVLANA
ncbi:addiction module antitoxin%2C RelB/DinJ family [uncultured Eubacterium sp.]|nr:addiction module antitoxin%2C RelB/DinJ family [uncultured Eubacterium sp.]